MGQDWTFVAVLLKMTQVIGVLPVKWNTHINYTLHLCGQDLYCFSTSRRWQMFSFFNLAFIIYRSYILFLTVPSKFLLSITGLVLIISNGSAVCTLLLVIFYKPQELVLCCSEACKVYSLSSQQKMIPLWLFTLLCVYPFVTIFYVIIYKMLNNLSLEIFLILLRSNYLYTPIAGVEVVVTIFCLVSSRSYTNINKKMKNLKLLNNKKSFKYFISLLKKHIFVSKFCQRFAGHFGPHLLNTFIGYILKMIWFAITIIECVRSGKEENILPFCIHALYTTGRLFFLCHWCQKVQLELDGYEEIMQNCKVEFTACGMFSISLQQILNVLGVIATYSLVALQTR